MCITHGLFELVIGVQFIAQLCCIRRVIAIDNEISIYKRIDRPANNGTNTNNAQPRGNALSNNGFANKISFVSYLDGVAMTKSVLDGMIEHNLLKVIADHDLLPLLVPQFVGGVFGTN